MFPLLYLEQLGHGTVIPAFKMCVPMHAPPFALYLFFLSPTFCSKFYWPLDKYRLRDSPYYEGLSCCSSAQISNFQSGDYCSIVTRAKGP